MNKDFARFLRNRPKGDNPSACNHGKAFWCQNCIRRPTYVDLRKQGFGAGYIFMDEAAEIDDATIALYESRIRKR